MNKTSLLLLEKFHCVLVVQILCQKVGPLEDYLKELFSMETWKQVMLLDRTHGLVRE